MDRARPLRPTRILWGLALLSGQKAFRCKFWEPLLTNIPLFVSLRIQTGRIHPVFGQFFELFSKFESQRGKICPPFASRDLQMREIWPDDFRNSYNQGNFCPRLLGIAPLRIAFLVELTGMTFRLLLPDGFRPLLLALIPRFFCEKKSSEFKSPDFGVFAPWSKASVHCLG